MKVEIREDGFHLDGKRVDFISGEFHYWRVKKENWPKIIERLKTMGVKVISTYVPWNFHQVNSGFDFNGRTDRQRDLRGFIDLVWNEGFQMMLRPGPYIYAEWSFAGATAEAFKHHRFSDKFKRLASPYIKAVSKECIVPNLATRGGPIFVVQVDNEIDPWVRFYRDQLGLSKGSGPFKDFLVEKYSKVDRLNSAWRSSYRSFEEAEPCEEQPGGSGVNVVPNVYRRYLDYRLFPDWAVEQIFVWSANLYRECGVDVPLVTNTYDDLVFHDLTKIRRVTHLVCMDIYLKNQLPPPELLKLSYWIKAYSAYSKLPLSTEFQSGIWVDSLHDTGPIDGRHERLLALAAMAWGLKGWNWYMAVGRDNWTCSPINEWGLINPDIYASMAGVCELYHKVRPLDLRRLTSISLVHYRPQLLLRDPSKILSGEDGWGCCFRNLHDAGLDFTFYNPEIDEERSELMVYAGDIMMEPADAENLIGAAEKGSHLVFFRHPPTSDFEGSELASFKTLPTPIGSRGEPRGRPSRVVLSRGPVQRVVDLCGFYYYDDRSGDKITLKGTLRPSPYVEEEPVIGEHVVGFSNEIKDGRITVLGFDPTLEAIKFLMDAFGVKTPVTAKTPCTCASLHEDVRTAGRYVIFLINSSLQRQIASADVNLPDGSYRFHALSSKHEGTLEGGRAEMTVPVDWKDVEVIEVTQRR